MTDAQLDAILNSCKPVPMIMLHIGSPESPQERANRAWEKLGKEMGFDSTTIQPVEGKDYHFFTAVPREPEEARQARIHSEKETEIKGKIAALEEEMEAQNAALSKLLAEAKALNPSSLPSS